MDGVYFSETRGHSFSITPNRFLNIKQSLLSQYHHYHFHLFFSFYIISHLLLASFNSLQQFKNSLYAILSSIILPFFNTARLLLRITMVILLPLLKNMTTVLTSKHLHGALKPLWPGYTLSSLVLHKWP